MKHFFTIVFAFTICLVRVQAQSLERQVLGTAGNFSTATWGSLSSTAGEAMTNTLSVTATTLTQGFQQPLKSDLTTGIKNISTGEASVKVYPNPASNKINVVLNTGNAHDRYLVSLSDLLGQKLAVPFETINGGSETLTFIFDVQHLAAASYFIIINDEHGTVVNTFKFTKIN